MTPACHPVRATARCCSQRRSIPANQPAAITMNTPELARRRISPATISRRTRLLASLVVALSLAACAVVPIDEYGDPVPVSPAEAAVSTAIVTFGALHFLGALGRHRGHHHWGSRQRGPRGFDRGHRSNRGWGRGHRSRGGGRSYRRGGPDGGGHGRGGRPSRSRY